MNPRKWHTIVPLRVWFCLHTETHDVRVYFRLISYDIRDGDLKFTFEYQYANPLFSDVAASAISGGTKPILIPELSITVFNPVTLEKISKLGYSPKFVMEMDRELTITSLRDMPAPRRPMDFSPVQISV